MITPRQAHSLIARHARPLGAITVSLGAALGRVLSRDVRAKYPLPHFDNSAMDGYALRSNDTLGAGALSPVRLRLRRTVYAGDTRRHALRTGEACGIMTGAPVPRGADTIVPIERASTEEEYLVVTSPVSSGAHVRRRGEELEAGVTVVKAGTFIHPGVIACLATVGIARVPVVRAPVVSVVATGSETIAPGRRPAHGQIYDSNSYAMAAALAQMGVERVFRRRVKDTPAALDAALRAALAKSDVTIVTGGVSVGERDYVKHILKKLRVRQVFWRVAQKPGKPLYFGARGRKLVFGLPGNPASAFTAFYLYVYPTLRRLSGLQACDLETATETVGELQRDATRWLFLKGRADGGAVGVLRGQGSHMVSAFVAANRLVVVPPAASDEGPAVLELPYEGDT